MQNFRVAPSMQSQRIQSSSLCPEILLNGSTWVDLLRQRTLHQPDQVAFTFLSDGETEGDRLTYQELDRQARAIASQLQARGLSSERALLLYPPGLEYLAAFFGCLYAGVVAVPAYPPRNQRNMPRIQAVVANAQAAIALTTTATLSKVQSLLAEKTALGNLQWLTTDSLGNGLEESWQEPSITTETLAFLQYTSGSTGTPKGVMLSHGNLLHNAAMTYRLMEHSPQSKFVSWLPTYHDMGLIGGILQPLYGGFPCILMPPAAFLQRPYRWLQAISRYQGTTSGGPNFAYELCLQRITPEQLETLDLSSWDVAFNGAEPIQPETLQKFCSKFAPCGFRQEAFYPCYGMAEASLMVSGGRKMAPPVFKTIQGDALEHNQAIEASTEDQNKTIYALVSCGQTLPDQTIRIVHPETLTQCLPNEIGEIWVSGASIGYGYWHQQEETKKTFCAYLSDTGQGPFLRTGDLGFLQNGELFITGRLKDLIIIRGRNLYPQDIERTVERSHPSLRTGSGAAFTVEVDNEERLVVVQELEFRAKPNIEEVTAAIRQAVTEDHEVQVYGVVLIKPGSIPKTSSGKIQRRACKAKFLASNLIVIERSILNVAGFVETIPSLNRDALLSLPPGEGQLLLESYLQKLVAQVMQIIPSKINLQHSLSSLGLDSLRVFELKNRIEVDLEVTVSIGDFFEGLTIAQWAIKILGQLTTADCMPSVPLKKLPTATNVHPLSFGQQRLWFIDQLEPGNPAYNISFAIRLDGSLKVTLLERSLNEIVHRHEILRTTFSIVNGQPVQIIAPSLRLILSVVDYQELPELERESEAQRVATQESQQPFDLTHGPLLRAKLVRLGQQKHRLLLTMHHIILDGLSAEVFIQEMVTLYKAFLTESSLPLPELSIQYKDFVYWQRQWLQGEPLETQLNYWKQQLEGVPAVLQLPTDHPRPAVQTFRGASQSLALPQTLTDKLKALSRQEGVTLFMVLLAAFQTVLYRYTGQNDIPVGSPIANRNHVELKGLIGFFVNTLVLRTNLGGNPSFRELLGRVRQVALGAYAHHDLPFEQLVETLRPQRDVSYNPLFQVSFTLQNAPQLEEIPGLTLNQLKVESLTSQFDLSLLVEITQEELTASFEYNTDLFENATITRMLGHFRNLLEGIVANPDQSLSDLPLLSEAEQYQQLVAWNDTQAEYPKDLCIHQLFEAQVERSPDATAVVFENQQLTYRELNNRANQLAHYLQKLGVAPELLVGICVERSLEMVIGLLAVLKAGGAYVPLDPSYPRERLSFMLSDSQASVLLTQQKLVSALPEHQADVVYLDDYQKLTKSESEENLVSGVKPENLAYVIYTSGSTGKPKGVTIEHQAIVNHMSWMQSCFPLKETDKVIQKTPFSFDASVWEFYAPLLVGAQLVMARPGGHQDSNYLIQVIREQKITILQLVPTLLRMLLEHRDISTCTSLKRVFCGGEVLSVELQERFFALLNADLHNLYGPTETCIDATFWTCKGRINQQTVPIGRPIANTQIYILDSHLQLVPIGVPGELYIGGDGLARGYLNRPELTAEKFIPNPFSDKPGTRLYRTGDLVRYLPKGEIEYLGRIDHQVKIRGFRIELGEIESILSQHPAVREVVVLAREEQPSDKQLVAYIVPEKEQTPTTSELRNYLKEQLPEYIVPSVFMLLKVMPLTSNGKVNRHAFPAPDRLRPTLAATYEAPRSEMERTLTTIWQEVLHLEKVGVNDNFFDLGGHSLLMVQVHNKIKEVFNCNFSIIEMFHNPTIRSLVQYLSHKQKEQSSFGAMHDRVQKQLEARKRRQHFTT